MQKSKQYAENQPFTRLKIDIKEVSFRISSTCRTFVEEIFQECARYHNFSFFASYLCGKRKKDTNGNG